MEESFQQASIAMLAFMCGAEYYKNILATPEEIQLKLSAPDRESLLHDFLDEVLFMFSQGKVAIGFHGMQIHRVDDEFVVETVAMVVKYDRQLHGNGSEVKAVTWSNIKVGGGFPFDAYVVLDI
jgi:SHS2 domain-containing protein